MVVYTICCVCTIKRCLYFPVLFTFLVLFTSLNFVFVSCLFTFLRFEYILFTFVVLFSSLNFVFDSCLFAFLRFEYILFTFVVFFVCYLFAFWNSVYVLFLFVVLFTCFWANDVFYVLQNEKKKPTEQITSCDFFARPRGVRQQICYESCCLDMR